MNNDMECVTCIKRKTKWCPNSSECYETIDKPYYQNRIMLLEENQKYKEVIEKLKDAIGECWYMDSENIGEQVFLKKIELQNILKEV